MCVAISRMAHMKLYKHGAYTCARLNEENNVRFAHGQQTGTEMNRFDLSVYVIVLCLCKK